MAMDPITTVFSEPEYEPLKHAFVEGRRDPMTCQRSRTLVKLAKKKNTVLSFCVKADLLLRDEELWDTVENMFTAPFQPMRYRQIIMKNVVKGIFILHKEKAKRFYTFCSRSLLRVYLRPFNKKLDEVVVLRRIRPGLPRYNPPDVRFHRQYNEELWNRFYEESRTILQEIARSSPEDALMQDIQRMTPPATPVPVNTNRIVERHRQGDHVHLPPARLDSLFENVVGEHPPDVAQMDLYTAQARMDIDGAVEGDSVPDARVRLRPDDQLDLLVDREFQQHPLDVALMDLHTAQVPMDIVEGDSAQDTRVGLPRDDLLDLLVNREVRENPPVIVDDSPPLTLSELQPIVVQAQVHASADYSPPLRVSEQQPIVVQAQVPVSAETFQDDRQAAEPPSIDYLFSDLRPDTDPMQRDIAGPDVDIVTPIGEELQTRTSPINIMDILPELPPQISVITGEFPSSDRSVDPLAAVQVDRPIGEGMPADLVVTDQPPIEVLPIEPIQTDVASGDRPDTGQPISAGIRSDQPDLYRIADGTEPRTRKTDVIDIASIPVSQPVVATDEIQFSEGFPELPVTIDGDRPADEVAGFHPAEDIPAPALMDVIELDANQPVPDVHLAQQDQIQSVQQPVQDLPVQTERDAGREAEINIQRLQRDFDRIEVVSVDEIELAPVEHSVPTARPNQMEIPDIVVTEFGRTIDSAVVEPADVPENGRAEGPMEVEPQPTRETSMIRISDLMQGDASWEKERQKKPKKRIPINFTPKQMRRIISRPLVRSGDLPTLAAEVYTETRPNVLSPLRFLLQEPTDIHDLWETPYNYADKLKEYHQKECKFTLQQIIPFSQGVIFKRLKPGFIDEMTEEERRDQEKGKRALRTIVNFPKIPSQVILRLYGDKSPSESPSKARTSLRHPIEILQLDVPNLDRKSLTPQPRERRTSLVPDAAIPPRLSIEPYLVGEVLDRRVLDESIIVQLPPSEEALITIPQEGLNQTGIAEGPSPSVAGPAAAVGEDLDRLLVGEEDRSSMPAPSYKTEQQQIPLLPEHIAAAEENLNRIEATADVSITMPTRTSTSADDVIHPGAIQQEGPLVATQIAPPEDINRIDAVADVSITMPARTSISADNVIHPGAIQPEIPLVAAPIAAPEDINRLDVVADVSIAMPTRTSTSADNVIHPGAIQPDIPSMAAPIAAPEDINRLDVVADVSIAMPAPILPLVDDVIHPEAILQEGPAEAAPVPAPEDMNRMEILVDPNAHLYDPPPTLYELNTPLKHIVKSEVVYKLASLLEEEAGPVLFTNLCPPSRMDSTPEIKLTRSQVAETFILLMELHTEKLCRLEYNYKAGEIVSDSNSKLLIHRCEISSTS